MPSGAAVIRYDGKRGTTWFVKFRDATGRQVKEKLGTTREGWTRRKAEAALRRRLVDVEREGFVKPVRETFETFAREWLATYPDAKSLKRSTRQSYEAIVNAHLVPRFGSMRLEQIDVDELDRYLAAKRREGLAPASINRHLNMLSLLMGAAVRRRLVRVNPVSLVDRPKEPRRRWAILTPLEIVRVERAFSALVDEADDDERAWLEQARVVFLVVVGIGLRRGEVLGLHWRNVRLADPNGAVLRVEETWVRDRVDTPKSEAGERTIDLGRRVADELWNHRGRSTFAGDDERVFCNLHTGGPLDHKRYAVTLRAALAKAKVDRVVRPFHDGRHTSITNAAAAGLAPAVLMARAGHSSFKTTQGYIDLAGQAFREEAERVEERIFGVSGTKTRYQEPRAASTEATEAA